MRTLTRTRPAKAPGNFLAILFGAYRREVLSILLLRPEESFHVREIARLTGVPAGSLHRELKLLLEAGLLLREPLGNQVRYRANRTHPIYTELAEIFRKTSGLADVLRVALAPIEQDIDIAFVFGSMARGTERSVSDIDVLVIGAVTLFDVVKALNPTQERLGREVNPIVLTKREARAKLKDSDAFLARISREDKIYLIGSEDELRQLAENRAA